MRIAVLSLAACLVLFAGYAAAKRARAPAAFDLVLPRACIRSLTLTPRTECHGSDPKHWQCAPVALDYVPGCEHMEVLPGGR